MLNSFVYKGIELKRWLTTEGSQATLDTLPMIFEQFCPTAIDPNRLYEARLHLLLVARHHTKYLEVCRLHTITTDKSEIDDTAIYIAGDNPLER